MLGGQEVRLRCRKALTINVTDVVNVIGLCQMTVNDNAEVFGCSGVARLQLMVGPY